MVISKELPEALAAKAQRRNWYTRENADQLLRITYPQGQWLEYSYDADGRRRSMTD